MFKKLILFSTIAILGGCETINQASQCDPEKNYLISNPQAMEEYKSLFRNKKIKGYYFNNLTPKYCDDSLCMFFDTKKFEYMEIYFNDSKRKGVYTIKESTNNENCIKQNSSMNDNLDKKCFIATKNEEGSILSRYEYQTYNNENQTIIKFIDRKNNSILYEESHQIYSTKALGSYGFGICKKEQKTTFSTNSFPEQ